jgi:hypothetical protein
VERRLSAGLDAQTVRPALEQRYRGALRRAEQACRERVQSLYRHEAVERQEPELAALDEDLFSEGTWLLFGLGRADLAKAGAAGGALAGLGVDAATGGGSLLLGAAIGALAGGITSWLSADALAELKVERLPLGGRVARYGPSRNLNLPFVLLGRARVHHHLLAARSHARREPLDIVGQGALNPLDDARRSRLARVMAGVSKSDPGSARRATAVQRLAEAIGELLEADEAAPQAAPPGG